MRIDIQRMIIHRYGFLSIFTSPFPDQSLAIPFDITRRVYVLLRARRKPERALLRISENPEYERPAGRSWSRFSETCTSGTESPIDKRSSLVGNPIPLECRGAMPNHASTFYGTWRVPPVECHKFPSCFSVTAGPTVLKFCMRLGVPLVTAYAVVTGGVFLHVRTCRDTPTRRFCIS